MNDTITNEDKLKKPKVYPTLLAAYCESWLDYGFIAAKIYRQANIPIPRSLPQLYRGITAFQTSLLPSIGLQRIYNDAYEDLLLDSSSSLKNSLGYSIGGALSAIVATPIEYIILQQQKLAMQPWQAMQSIIYNQSIHHLWRGFIPTALREAGFAWSVWYGNKLTEAMLKEYFGLNDAAIAGAVFSGTTAGIITHPYDLIGTYIQNNQLKISIRSAFKQVYNQEGLSGLYKGFILRTASIIGAAFWLPFLYEYFYYERKTVPSQSLKDTSQVMHVKANSTLENDKKESELDFPKKLNANYHCQFFKHPIDRDPTESKEEEAEENTKSIISVKP